MDYPINHMLAFDDELRAETELDYMQLTKNEISVLKGMMSAVFMPMDLIDDQAALDKLLKRGFLHQMELTRVVTITFKGIEYLQKSKVDTKSENS